MLHKKVWRLSIFLILLTTILYACEKKENIPEKSFSIDFAEETAIPEIAQVVCGEESAWIITSAKNDSIYRLTYPIGSSTMEKIEWQPKEGDYYIVNVADKDGILYVQLYSQSLDSLIIRKYGFNGTWSEVMSVTAENKIKYAVVGSGFFVDEKEQIYLVSDHTVTCFDLAGNQLVSYEFKDQICSFQKNQDNVECVTMSPYEITLFSLLPDRAEKKWSLQSSTGQAHSIKSSDDNILCLATDQEVLFIDKVTGILTSKTDILKLGLTQVLSGYYHAFEGTIELYCELGNGTLKGIHLSQRDAEVQQRTEIVYGIVEPVNTDTASSVMFAISQFNQENEEYFVSVKNYDGNLLRLQGDMAAGTAPDIIDMMDSDYYDSYVANGVLENLMPYLEASKYYDDIIWNVLDTYKIDGSLYLFVPQFQLRGILLPTEEKIPLEKWNMNTFLDLLASNQGKRHIFRNAPLDPLEMLHFLMSGQQNRFFNWEQKTAAFTSDEFINLLELCKEYAKAEKENIENQIGEELDNSILCKVDTYGMGFYSYLSNVDSYGRDYPIYGYPTLEVQSYKIRACYDSCAIFASSKQKEGAWAFIESLMEDSNQEYHGIVNPGFPIRRSLLKEMAEQDKNVQFRSGTEIVSVTDDEIAIINDIIFNGNLMDDLKDPLIWKIIQEETAFYFAGDKSAQEVADIIQNRVQLILDEA
jgi:ABC-type glycerol-3-phosphate transport system substrate-binding protein